MPGRIIAIVCCLAVLGAGAGAQVGLRVVDGDTLVLGSERIRLAGIDAPERGQVCAARSGPGWACGTEATAELTRLVAGGGLECVGHHQDIYGRRLARCHGAAGDLGQAMVAAGLAMAFGQEAGLYRPAEHQAELAGLGIWQNPAGYLPPHPLHRAACTIKGNIGRSGRIYHLPGQRFYRAARIDPGQGERWFCSEAAAVVAGWRRART